MKLTQLQARGLVDIADLIWFEQKDKAPKGTYEFIDISGVWPYLVSMQLVEGVPTGTFPLPPEMIEYSTYAQLALTDRGNQLYHYYHRGN